MPHVTRSVVFRGPDEKAAWLDAMATLDARLPETRSLARRFAVSIDPNELGAIARLFHRFVRDSIRYVRDPAGEEFSDSDVILSRGYGDCDDKARLFVALSRSVGLVARIRPCFEGDEFVHVQAEVLLDSLSGGACFVEAGDCRWATSELIVKDVELGELPPRRPQLT